MCRIRCFTKDDPVLGASDGRRKVYGAALQSPRRGPRSNRFDRAETKKRKEKPKNTIGKRTTERSTRGRNRFDRRRSMSSSRTGRVDVESRHGTCVNVKSDYAPRGVYLGIHRSRQRRPFSTANGEEERPRWRMCDGSWCFQQFVLYYIFCTMCRRN